MLLDLFTWNIIERANKCSGMNHFYCTFGMVECDEWTASFYFTFYRMNEWMNGYRDW